MASLVPDLKKYITGIEIKGGVASVSENTWRKIAGMINFIGHRTHQEKNFYLNGPYWVVSTPNTGVDGLAVFEFDAEIFNVWVYNLTAGTTGTTELDIKLKPKSSGSFTSIFYTTPKVTSAAPDNTFFEIGDSLTGVTAPVLAGGVPKSVNRGDALRIDLISAMHGAKSCGVIIHYRPR